MLIKTTSMKLQPCTTDNSLLSADLSNAAIQQTLDKITVMETPSGFYVVVQIRWSGLKDWYLATRRDRNEPRLFVDLTRLNNHLLEISPLTGFELIRQMNLPPRSVPKAPALY